jgi:hypothetical protein
MKTTAVNLLLILSLLAITVSCTQRDKSIYRFTYIAKDTLASKDIALVLREPFSCGVKPLSMNLSVISPGGRIYKDSLTVPVYDVTGSLTRVNSGLWLDSKWIYKKGVQFPEKGSWSFLIYTGKENSRCIKKLIMSVK